MSEPGGNGEVVALLTRIAETQNEALELARDTAKRSLEAQQLALALQQRTARLYRRVVAVSGIVVIALIAYLFL